MTKQEYDASVYGGETAPEALHALNKEALELSARLADDTTKRVKAAKKDTDYADVYKLDAKTRRKVAEVVAEIDALPDWQLDTLSFPFVAQSLRTQRSHLQGYLGAHEVASGR